MSKVRPRLMKTYLPTYKTTKKKTRFTNKQNKPKSTARLLSWYRFYDWSILPSRIVFIHPLLGEHLLLILGLVNYWWIPLTIIYDQHLRITFEIWDYNTNKKYDACLLEASSITNIFAIFFTAIGITLFIWNEIWKITYSYNQLTKFEVSQAIPISNFSHS